MRQRRKKETEYNNKINKTMKQKLSPKLISLTFGILVICFAIGFYVFAWIDPSAAPPGGNVDAPVNVGSTAQTKTGNLTLPNLYLNATANEGNIYNINNLIGYNDIYVKGNSSETAPVYIGGNLIKLYTSGLERVSIGLTGVVAVTNNLTVAGQSVCRQDGTNCPAGAASLWTDIGTYIRPDNYTSLAITDTGRLGIGTTSPTYKLDVVGNIGLSQYLYHNDDTNTYLNFESDRLRAYIGSEYLLDLYEGTQDYVKLGDGGDVDIDLNDDMFVRGSDGRVGIGTESPAQKLHVVGNARFTGVPNCTGGSTLDTNASGDLVCGTDDGGASYSAGEGINIVGTTISIKAPTSVAKGGVKTKTCSYPEAIVEIRDDGTPVCEEFGGGAVDTSSVSCKVDEPNTTGASCQMRCSPDYSSRLNTITSESTNTAYSWSHWNGDDNIRCESYSPGKWVKCTGTCVKTVGTGAVASYQVDCKVDEPGTTNAGGYMTCDSSYSISLNSITKESGTTATWDYWNGSHQIRCKSSAAGRWVKCVGTCTR